MDNFRQDGHKLHHHVARVNEWLQGGNTVPVYIETSPSGACNHRCRFCGKDFMDYRKRFLDTGMFMDRLAEMGRLGVKSIMHAGEGEPLLHPDLEVFVRHGKESGIDQAVNTNGVLLTPDRAEKLLPYCEWIRVSLDAGSAETHEKLHRAKKGDYAQILSNLAEAARMRRERGWRCTLGVQMLLLPENRDEIAPLAEQLKPLGVDYLSVKPYSQHPQSRTEQYSDISYAEDVKMRGAVEALGAPGFSVTFRAQAMQKWDSGERPYKRCYAMRFWTYIDAGADVWGCCNHLNDDRFYFGNLNTNTFQEVWDGERRMKALAWVENEMDTCQCRVNCRMDEVNRYLWELKNPPGHVNFI